MSLLPPPHPPPDGKFVALPQATWTGTTMRPSRNLGTTLSCSTWTTAAGKAGGGGEKQSQQRGGGRPRVLPKRALPWALSRGVMPPSRPPAGFSPPSFGTHSRDELSILAPLRQCCR